ncbi:MAG: hypothetical protein AB7F98_05640 [Novosphingobium sp.]
MSKFVPLALLATVATLAVVPSVVFAAETNQQVRESSEAVAAAPVAATAGRMVYGPDGNRIAAVYRVRSNGDAELILNSKLVTVPAATLSLVDGKLATSLTKKELNRR